MNAFRRSPGMNVIETFPVVRKPHYWRQFSEISIFLVVLSCLNHRLHGLHGLHGEERLLSVRLS